MSVEVVMPQMGESITEGTVSKWLKQVGDKIDKDEAILEISTDKVDAEVPGPGAGVMLEIRHNEGETVEVGTVLAVIGAEGEQPASLAGSTNAAAPTANTASTTKCDGPNAENSRCAENMSITLLATPCPHHVLDPARRLHRVFVLPHSHTDPTGFF